MLQRHTIFNFNDTVTAENKSKYVLGSQRLKQHKLTLQRIKNKVI